MLAHDDVHHPEVPLLQRWDGRSGQVPEEAVQEVRNWSDKDIVVVSVLLLLIALYAMLAVVRCSNVCFATRRWFTLESTLTAKPSETLTRLKEAVDACLAADGEITLLNFHEEGLYDLLRACEEAGEAEEVRAIWEHLPCHWRVDED